MSPIRLLQIIQFRVMGELEPIPAMITTFIKIMSHYALQVYS